MTWPVALMMGISIGALASGLLLAGLMRLERWRARRLVPVRVTRDWKLGRLKDGRVTLELEENFRFRGDGDGRYWQSTITFQGAEFGEQVWSHVREQRETVVESSLAEGARVAGIEGVK